MVWYKKVCREELLQLVLILGLLGVDRELYRRTNDFHPVGVGIDGGGVRFENAHFNNPFNNRIGRVHPKSLDSVLLSYERDILEDLNALGRYNRIEPLNHNVTAYVLNVDVGSVRLGSLGSSVGTEPEEPTPAPSGPSPPGSELTQEVSHCLFCVLSKAHLAASAPVCFG
ncbi:hypothetical protein ONE63_002899 [Megalurothrips usitatus]|uniref:Uncharacterized protein n=1 Tax=Megalurothrips usitatus TaxID=439358 RepID=A0AAV7XC97_9NEOP|nr:hypothetical protein ONE63_002899 [Megalurothrips usitatus]